MQTFGSDFSSMKPISLKALMPKDWALLLEDDFAADRFINLERNLNQVYQERGELIAPLPENIFRALRETSVSDVKVIILGQDPYQTPGLAQGLSFSIPREIKPGWRAFPSSLRNISKAIALDGYSALTHGDLLNWAKQGVLLLNAALTVQLELAGSHSQLGWQEFTDALLYRLALHRNNLIWVLWGAHAQKKKILIEKASQESGNTHHILTASHPSGLSVYKTSEPFIYPGDEKACGHFRKINEILAKQRVSPIIWA
jgi:uracil-DNA glycosylase